MTEHHNKDYPDEFDQEPPDDDPPAESTLVRVRRYDKHDVLMSTQFFMMLRDPEQGSHIVSSIMEPAEPESDRQNV